jgi:hypothetical protein
LKIIDAHGGVYCFNDDVQPPRRVSPPLVIAANTDAVRVFRFCDVVTSQFEFSPEKVPYRIEVEINSDTHRNDCIPHP